VLKGYTQSPIEGESFARTFTDPAAAGRATQFYSMLGMRSLYHEGWLANTLHPPISGWGNFHLDEWELYHLAEDRSQLRNLAAEEPARLAELKEMWSYYAGIYKGLPLDDRTPLEIISDVRPQPSAPRGRYVYYPGAADVPESVAVNVRRRSYTIAAAVRLDAPDASGVLFAQGARAGGHALWMKDGRLHYTYNWLGEQEQTVSSGVEVPAGSHVLSAEFQKTGDDEKTHSAIGTVTLFVDTDAAGSLAIITQPGMFGLSGAGVAVGRGNGSSVSSDYAGPFPFTGGTIERVIVDVSGEHYVDHEKEVLAYLARD
jgi:arylsulfatase